MSARLAKFAAFSSHLNSLFLLLGLLLPISLGCQGHTPSANTEARAAYLASLNDPGFDRPVEIETLSPDSTETDNENLDGDDPGDGGNEDMVRQGIISPNVTDPHLRGARPFQAVGETYPVLFPKGPQIGFLQRTKAGVFQFQAVTIRESIKQGKGEIAGQEIEFDPTKRGKGAVVNTSELQVPDCTNLGAYAACTFNNETFVILVYHQAMDNLIRNFVEEERIEFSNLAGDDEDTPRAYQGVQLAPKFKRFKSHGGSAKLDLTLAPTPDGSGYQLKVWRTGFRGPNDSSNETPWAIATFEDIDLPTPFQKAGTRKELSLAPLGDADHLCLLVKVRHAGEETWIFAYPKTNA